MSEVLSEQAASGPAEAAVAVGDAAPEALPGSSDVGRGGSESAAEVEPRQLEALVSAMQPQTLSDRPFEPHQVRGCTSPPHHPIATVRAAQNPPRWCERSTGFASGAARHGVTGWSTSTGLACTRASPVRV